MKICRLFAALTALAMCLLLAGGACAQTPEKAKPDAQLGAPAAKAGEATLAPRAIELLKATCDRLAKAESMSFTATVNYEYPSRLGPPIVYAMRYDVTIKRPDKLKVVMPGDGPASEFYYDGQESMAFAPAENLVAIAKAPPTMDAALKQAFDEADIYFPFTDLIVDDPYAALAGGAKLAFYVGQSDVVGGTKTQIVAWADDDVFLQMWIGADDMLPRRIRAVYSADPLRLRHDMTLSGWRLDQPVAPEAFASQKARAAKPIPFARPMAPAGETGQNPAPGAPDSFNSTTTPQ